jgi:hypothetical protein
LVRSDWLAILLAFTATPLFAIDFIKRSHQASEKWGPIHGPHPVKDAA